MYDARSTDLLRSLDTKKSRNQSRSVGQLPLPLPQRFESYESEANSRSDRPAEHLSKKPIDAVFEIYGVGFGYSTAQGYGGALGMGFLITEHLCITAHSVLPEEEVANRCFARFPDNIYETHQFDVRSFFYTNRGLNFTVVGYKHNPDSRRKRVPIEIREPFTLKEGDGIAFLNAGVVWKEVCGVERDVFSYTAGTYIPPGMPIFSSDWRLQGMHHTCTAAYRFNQGTRLDSILKSLSAVRSVATHPELDLLLNEYSSTKASKFDSSARLAEQRFLYWFEALGRGIHRYDAVLDRWNRMRVNNAEDFLVGETSTWSFNTNTRVIPLPDASLLIVGGVTNELSATQSDVYQYYPDSGMLFRRMNMQEQREAPALVYRQGWVYALGGKYSYNTCEKYCIETDTWVHFAPLIRDRYAATASTLQSDQFIYCVGGYPAEMVGHTCERFSFAQDRWELLSLKFPTAMLNIAMFAVTQRKLAIFGGRLSRSVFLLDCQEETMILHSSQVRDEAFRLLELEGFMQPVESNYPVIFVAATNNCYILTTDVPPKVVVYPYRNFLKAPLGDAGKYNRTVQLPPLQQEKRHLLVPAYKDSYY